MTNTDPAPPAGPYGDHALTYLSAGWAPLPLPAGAKKHPPKGWTGAGGAWPSGADVHAWAEDHAGGNIALRLPPGVIGIDVDNYDTKPGALVLDQLETDHGPLPATWRSTSRDDGISGIRFYQAPEGLRWPSVLGPGIEVIRHGHRYAVAAPSAHPNGGTYRWITPDGATALNDIPHPDNLPHLPQEWVAHFTGGELAGDQARADLGDQGATNWLTAREGVGMCRGMESLATKAITGLATAGSRHDHTLTETNRLIWTAGTGHTGITTALGQLRDAFLAATAGERGHGEAENEWDRLVVGAVNLAAAAHPTDPPPDPCTQDDLHQLIPHRKATTPWTYPNTDTTSETATSTPPSSQNASSASPTSSTPPESASGHPAPPAPTPDASDPLSTIAAPTATGQDESGAEPPTWAKIDLGPYLDGTYKPLIPSLFPRGDGVCLLYPGKTHSFHGESESGKSLVLQIQAAHLIIAARPVLYIDFEDDAPSVTQRLLDFGATPQQILDHFDYRRPEVNPSSTVEELQAWMDMLSRHYDLAVIDGVTDSLGVFGYSTKDNDEITKWMRAFPRNLAKVTGAAVVVIDHVTKNSETRGRFALGGQAKMNAITGSAFTVEIDKPLGKGLRGVIVLRVAKDRGGYLRARSGPMRAADRTQETARIIVDSTGPDPTVTVEPPAVAAQSSGAIAPTRMTGVMEKISRTLESADGPLTGRGLQELVGGNKDRFTAGLRTLLAEGYITVSTGQRGANMHTSSRPYRQREDPLSDMYGGDLRGIIPPPSPLSPTVPPASPGDSESECPPVPRPEGGTGTLKPAERQSPSPGGTVPDRWTPIAGGAQEANTRTGEIRNRT